MSAQRTEPYLSTYLHAKGRRLGLPIAGNFELTARCNFRCPMCYVHMGEDDINAAGKELTAAQWLSLAKDARDMGMMFVLLTGGEPFVRKDFFEIYKGMKQLGLIVSINTNGSMLHGEILNQLLQDPPTRINLSLYGASNETYRNMCGQPAFQTVVDNLAALKKAGVNVSINLSITPYNRNDLPEIYAISKKMDIHVRCSSYMYPNIRVNGGKYGCGNRLSPEDAAACGVEWDLLRFTHEEFQARAARIEKLTAVEPPECPVEADDGIRCRAGSTSFWVTWDGRMLPCGMMPGEGVRPLELGFADAWKSVRESAAQVHMPKECTSCAYRDLCSVCAAVTVTETGKFDGVPEYVCQHTKAMVQATVKAGKGR